MSYALPTSKIGSSHNNVWMVNKLHRRICDNSFNTDAVRTFMCLLHLRSGHTLINFLLLENLINAIMIKGLPSVRNIIEASV